MQNLIILGSGRSGTSMVTGLFRDTEAYFGTRFLPTKRANPYGYYEDVEINSLNNYIIKRLVNWDLIHRLPHQIRPKMYIDDRSLWLHVPKQTKHFSLPSDIINKFAKHLQQTPFCIKDPRFATTLSWWHELLPENTRFIVVFRDPGRTVDSILRDAAETYRPPLLVTEKWAYRSWYRTYSNILNNLSLTGKWLFVNYDDVVNLRAIHSLELFAQTKVNIEEINPKIGRASSSDRSENLLQQKCELVYQQLLQRANQDIELGRDKKICI